MQIFVKSLDSTFTVNVSENADVNELKAAIEDVEFVPAGKLYELLTILLAVDAIPSWTFLSTPST